MRLFNRSFRVLSEPSEQESKQFKSEIIANKWISAVDKDLFFHVRFDRYFAWQPPATVAGEQATWPAGTMAHPARRAWQHCYQIKQQMIQPKQRV